MPATLRPPNGSSIQLELLRVRALQAYSELAVMVLTSGIALHPGLTGP